MLMAGTDGTAGKGEGVGWLRTLSGVQQDERAETVVFIAPHK